MTCKVSQPEEKSALVRQQIPLMSSARWLQGWQPVLAPHLTDISDAREMQMCTRGVLGFNRDYKAFLSSCPVLGSAQVVTTFDVSNQDVFPFH